MWRILLVIFFVIIGWLVLKKKMKKKPNYDKTNELVVIEDVEDIEGHDILDRLMYKMSM